MIPRLAPFTLILTVLAAVVPTAAAGATAHPAKGGPRLLFSDTAQALDPLPLWGHVDCAIESRAQVIPLGGDPHPTISGLPQGDDSFRRLTVIDDDDLFGERCELGQNDRSGPVAFYRNGRRLVTQISIRLPVGYPLRVDTWQVVMQMKQTGPSSNSGGTPVLELDAYRGRWRLRQSLSRGPASDSRQLWSAPAAIGTWTRFSFKARYSSNPEKGRIKATADLNGDGDFADARERSSRIRTYTLKRETPGGSEDGLPAGRTIPSHLRAGIYHDPAIGCPPPQGCAVDIDNVQVMRLPRR
jgi:Polysaccharide lyase